MNGSGSSKVLNLRKFDISSIKDDSVVVMLGKRNTGKSVLVSDLLYYHRDIPVGTVISPTESSNKNYSNMVPSLFIHDSPTPQLIHRVVHRQKMVMKKFNREKEAFGSTNVDPRAFLLMDDCMYDGAWKTDKNISYLFFNGRHIKCFFIICMQYALGMPPNLRNNIDYVFILRENLINNRKRIYDSYCGMFPTFQIFCSVLDACTENFECLVVDNTSTSNKVEDLVFWYKADIHQPFKIGAAEFWQAHYNSCAEENDDDDNDMASFHDKGSARGGKDPVIVRKTL